MFYVEIIVVGGRNQFGDLTSVEIWDSNANGWHNGK